MPRSTDFYTTNQNNPPVQTPSTPKPTNEPQGLYKLNQPAAQPAASKFNGVPVDVANPVKKDPFDVGKAFRPSTVINNIKNTADQLKYFGQAIFDMGFPNKPADWDQKNLFQRYTWATKENAKKAMETVVSLPKVIAQSPFKVEQSIADMGQGLGDLAGKAYEKIGGKPIWNIENADPNFRIRGTSYNMPLLGKIRGTTESYQEGRNLGLSPLMSTIKATGEFAGDLSLVAGISDILASAMRPKMASLSAPLKGGDVRPNIATEVTQKAAKAGESKLATNGAFFESKQNPNITYGTLSPEVAAKYAGTPKNTFIKISPMGAGQAEYSIIQIKPSLAKNIKSLFVKGAEKPVVPGSMGMEVKLSTGVVKYDENLYKAKLAEEAAAKAPKAATTVETMAPQDINAEIQNMGIEDIFGPVSTAEKFNFTPEMENQYVAFKKLKLRNADEIEDIAQLKELKSKLPPEQIDNIFYSGEISGDEVFNTFKQRLMEERGITPAAGKSAFSPVETGTAQTTPAIATPKEKFQIQTAETPQMIAKPYKGTEDNLVDERTLRNLTFVKDSSKIGEPQFMAVAKGITGKENINEMTMKEAYDVQQTIKEVTDVGGKESPESVDWGYITRSQVTPTRDWMANAENTYGQTQGWKPFTDVYYPIETGMRLMKVKNTNDQLFVRDEVFGKYADPKYADDIRVISGYVKAGGNAKLIKDNPALTPEMKTDFIRIGDWMIDYFKKMKLFNQISSEKWFGTYLPEIEKVGGIRNLYKNLDELPQEIKPFFEYEREGSLNVLEDNPIVLLDIYNNLTNKNFFLGNALQKAKIKMAQYPENIKKATNDWVQERLGFQGKTAEALNGLFADLSKKYKIIPADAHKQLINLFMTNSYSGALGGRIDAVIRNIGQAYMAYAEFGPKYFAKGMMDFFSNPKGSTDYASGKGFLIEKGLPYGEELEKTSNRGIIGKTSDFYTKLNELAMKPYGSTDTVTRAPAAVMGRIRFDENFDLFKQGKITWDEFENQIGLKGYSKPLQNIVREKITSGKPEEIELAKDSLIQASIDDTMFPYRKGSEGRIFYGLKGKLGLQYMQWTAEYANTLAKWVKRGQWDKLVRFIYSTEAMKRSAKDRFGLDIDKWVGLGAFQGLGLPPMAQIVTNVAGAAINAMSDYDKDMNTNIDAIGRVAALYGGILTGVQAQRFGELKNSIDHYKTGMTPSPDPEKPFGIFSKTSGKLKFGWLNARELISYALGFKPEIISEQTKAIGQEFGAANKEASMKAKALNYLVTGKNEKFFDFIVKNNISFPDIQASLKSYQIPLVQRAYQTLSPQLKVKFFPVVYPQPSGR